MSVRCFVFCGVAISVPLSAQIFSANFMPSNIAGAPYSANQVTERTVIHADGTPVTIPAEEQTMYRDSAGRTRIDIDVRNCRTAPCLVTIVDPLAGFRYEINSYSRVVERFAIPVSQPPAIDPPSRTPDMVVSTRPIMDGAVRGIGMAENHFETTSEFLGTQMI